MSLFCFLSFKFWVRIISSQNFPPISSNFLPLLPPFSHIFISILPHFNSHFTPTLLPVYTNFNPIFEPFSPIPLSISPRLPLFSLFFVTIFPSFFPFIFQNLRDLKNHGEAKVPKFDFLARKRSEFKDLKIPRKNGVVSWPNRSFFPSFLRHKTCFFSLRFPSKLENFQVILEGMFALHPLFQQFLDVRISVVK